MTIENAITDNFYTGKKLHATRGWRGTDQTGHVAVSGVSQVREEVPLYRPVRRNDVQEPSGFGTIRESG